MLLYLFMSPVMLVCCRVIVRVTTLTIWFYVQLLYLGSEDKSRSRRPSVVEDETLLEMVEQKPNTNTRTLLLERGPSQNTINRYLCNLGRMNRRCRVS